MSVKYYFMYNIAKNSHALSKRSQFISYHFKIWTQLRIFWPAVKQTITNKIECIFQLIQWWSVIISWKNFFFNSLIKIIFLISWIAYLNGDIPKSLAITFFSISAADNSVIPNGPCRPCNSYSTMANEYTSPLWKSRAVGSPKRVERNNSGALYNNPTEIY